MWQQDCIPVGCVPPVFARISRHALCRGCLLSGGGWGCLLRGGVSQHAMGQLHFILNFVLNVEIYMKYCLSCFGESCDFSVTFCSLGVKNVMESQNVGSG